MPANRCGYCGAPARNGGACPSHVDLLRLDPLAQSARRLLTERELIAAAAIAAPPVVSLRDNGKGSRLGGQ